METTYKITSESGPGERSVTLLLNGKFEEESLPELEHFISAARGSSDRVYVDLSEVTLVDRKAIHYFSKRADQDVVLVNCPIYLLRWIGKGSDDVEN
ncbi:MAG: hypothetical protein JO270_21150 [Acidobacteriaceae bacterium]|nr:hypothetical protein [Acidobacteriaceae bacterium]MBV8571381.1 hypothetical protein [Acidobacteriaceae bacterium]